MNGPEPALPPPSRLGSVSAVIVIEDAAPDPQILAAWGDGLATMFADVELVLVANGVASPVALALEAVADELPDVTVHFLAERIDTDTARLVGMDTAIGDWVLLAGPRPSHLPALRELVRHVLSGYQVAIALGQNTDRCGLVYTLLATGYFGVYRLATGREVLKLPPVLRLYSRAAALYIAGSAEGEMLIKTDRVAGGFPTRIERYPGLAAAPSRRRSWQRTFAKAVQELLNASSMPLRLASMIALAGGVLSFLYSFYVIGVYLLKTDVLPGWTTMSLQLSGMMFLFSLLFALMSEYVLGIYRGLAPRRRYSITRELRSRHRRNAERLNVVDASGAFRLGMPVEDTVCDAR